MSTVAQVAQDAPYIVGLVSSFTLYATYPLAQAAAIALSASNSGAQVYVADVTEVITNAATTGTPPGGRDDLAAGGPGNWIIQLASTTTYLPKATAVAQAYATSAANSNNPVYVARTFQVCTGP